MRGKYHMMDWEQQRWKYIITKAIEKMEKTPDYTEDLTQQDICPANIRQTLESIGWEEIGFDDKEIRLLGITLTSLEPLHYRSIELPLWEIK